MAACSVGVEVTTAAFCNLIEEWLGETIEPDLPNESQSCTCVNHNERMWGITPWSWPPFRPPWVCCWITETSKDHWSLVTTSHQRKKEKVFGGCWTCRNRLQEVPSVMTCAQCWLCCSMGNLWMTIQLAWCVNNKAVLAWAPAVPHKNKSLESRLRLTWMKKVLKSLKGKKAYRNKSCLETGSGSWIRKETVYVGDAGVTKTAVDDDG